MKRLTSIIIALMCVATPNLGHSDGVHKYEICRNFDPKKQIIGQKF